MQSIRILKIKARTALAIGLPNLARVACYRLGLKFGINSARRLKAITPKGPFFSSLPTSEIDLAPVQNWRSKALLFGYWEYPITAAAPNWHYSPITDVSVLNSDVDWWKIPDFDSSVGDIKAIWEASRFDWVLALAQQARTGNSGAQEQLNTWLTDWCAHNPPYKGPNWKCGQEASIRVMHLAMAAVLSEQSKTAQYSLKNLIEIHLKRIAPTLTYAIAQDNNHGTSEAAALFIGGSWLSAQGSTTAKKWEMLGRKWLENRARRLIARDGTFSQYSVNYHRVMLDTFSMAEIWRRHFSLAPFSEELRTRLQAAVHWLQQMTDFTSGDACNLGANDGARLLPLTNTDYRDFRPSIQLASVLFSGKRAWAKPGAWDLPLQWLGIALPIAVAKSSSSEVFSEGGFAVLRRKGINAVFHFPRFRFRPSQADVLHLDVWKNGQNLLRDGGTYSYNTTHEWGDYFPSTRSHNTIQFDDHDQMPRLGRFLFGDWLKTEKMEELIDDNDHVSFGASYKSRNGNYHQRSICLRDTCLVVNDQVNGFTDKAVLRWRLAPGAWRMEHGQLTNGTDRVIVTSNVPIDRFALTEGWESRYYLQKTPLPVLEVEIRQPGRITTRFDWDA